MVLDAVNVMGLLSSFISSLRHPGPQRPCHRRDHTGTLLQIIKGDVMVLVAKPISATSVTWLPHHRRQDKGRVGECYILANEPVTPKEMCDMLHAECNAKQIKSTCL